MNTARASRRQDDLLDSDVKRVEAAVGSRAATTLWCVAVWRASGLALVARGSTAAEGVRAQAQSMGQIPASTPQSPPRATRTLSTTWQGLRAGIGPGGPGPSRFPAERRRAQSTPRRRGGRRLCPGGPGLEAVHAGQSCCRQSSADFPGHRGVRRSCDARLGALTRRGPPRVVLLGVRRAVQPSPTRARPPPRSASSPSPCRGPLAPAGGWRRSPGMPPLWPRASVPWRTDSNSLPRRQRMARMRWHE